MATQEQTLIVYKASWAIQYLSLDKVRYVCDWLRSLAIRLFDSNLHTNYKFESCPPHAIHVRMKYLRQYDAKWQLMLWETSHSQHFAQHNFMNTE